MEQERCLRLSDREKAVLHARYRGMTRAEIAEALSVTSACLDGWMARCERRECCRDQVELICRYIREYLGVGEPYGGDPWEAYLTANTIKAARAAA